MRAKSGVILGEAVTVTVTGMMVVVVEVMAAMMLGEKVGDGVCQPGCPWLTQFLPVAMSLANHKYTCF